jgi:amino acid adenylation domain-containing protein
MNDLAKRLAQLSPEKRRLLERQLTSKRTGPSRPQIPRLARDRDRFALSFAQQRLWFLDQLNPSMSAYNISLAMRLTGPLHISVLRESFNTIVRRHEMLRTTFPSRDGQPLQQITAPVLLPLPLVDLRHLPATEREQAARWLVRQQARCPFNLVRGPLFQTVLLRLGTAQHVLLLTLHHIVFDGWSIEIFLQELAVLYTAGLTEQYAHLPELSIQYADYAVWQRTQFQGQALDEQISYWQEHLAGAPATLELPTDRPYPSIQTSSGAAHRFMLPADTNLALKALSFAQGITPFMALLTTWHVLLMRYTGQSDIVIGSPVAGRSRSELEKLIGLFINILALHIDLRGNPTFHQALGRVREVCLGAYAHQDLPFEKLIEELRLERSLSHTLLFQVLFDFHNTPSASLRLPDLAIEWWEEDSGLGKFELGLTMRDSRHGFAGALEYNTDLFDEITIVRMTHHFAILLDSMLSGPALRISDLVLLSKEERQELIVTRNATQTSYPDTLCFHHLFALQIERSSDAIAVVFGEQQLTYRELDVRANQLANALRALNVGPEVRVAICMERSLELLIGLLGIFKAGGAFVPLDPALPKERMAFILADSSAPVLLTQSHLRARLPARAPGTAAPSILCLDADWVPLAGTAATCPISGVTAANLAYLIYTSGSTGRPKGVLIPHRSLVNYLVWCVDAYGAADGRGAPVHTSIAADAIFPSLFAPLLAGTCVIVLPEDHALEALSIALQQEGWFSLVKITPSQLEVLTQQLPQTDARGWMRTLVIGAEEVLGEVLRFWQANAPDTMLLNEYGPTETVVGCSIYVVPTGQVIEGSVPIGLPIDNTQFYVLDAHMQPVPISMSGELYIGGDGVAWGYHNRPDLSAATFVPDPFRGLPGARMYKTGDLVRLLPDRAGNIVFLGRIDDQVKIRGYRVEPGEIAAVLLHHPAVREAVVLAREDTIGDKRLVAYVVSNKETADSGQRTGTDASAFSTRNSSLTTELCSYLKQKLPDYMVPAAFVLLDALPLAPHGKLDRRALPAPDTFRPELDSTFVGPRTPAEETIAQIWAAILRLDEIGVNDNFFELGGHSLLATQVVSRIRDAFHIALPLRLIFEAPTVAGLAEAIDQLAHVSHEQGIRRVSLSAEEHTLARIDQLIDEEIDSLLAELLADEESVE